MDSGLHLLTFNEKNNNCRVGRRWAWIKGYEEIYKISDDGLVMSVARPPEWLHGATMLRPNKLHAPYKDRNGSLYAGGNMAGARRYIARLVAEAFIPNLNNLPCIIHLDRDKLNVNYQNLKWVSYSYKIKFTKATGNQIQGEDNASAKLKNVQVKEIRKEHKAGLSMAKLGVKYNVSRKCISKIINGITWKHIK